MIYVENMFRLESGAMGELVGSSMLVEVVNRLVELDVSCLNCLINYSLKRTFVHIDLNILYLALL